MSTQTWNTALYQENARFVTDLGAPVLHLLAPKAGEHILDLGCGDGVLTKKISDLGCAVVGLDSSPDFVASARKLGLTVVEQNANDMEFSARFDAVFSNAALHWMKDADRVIARVARRCAAPGAPVAEFGGHNCVKTVLTALIEELMPRPTAAQRIWYFPTVED